MTNPIQYTSRTYDSVLDDINTDENLKDKPTWFKRLIAGSHDVLSMYENAIANQSFLRTAFTRQAVTDLCALIDYHLSEKSPSTGTLLFYFNASTVSFPKTILVDDLKAKSEGTIAVSSLQFESRSGDTVTQTTETFTTDFATDNNLDVARVYLTGEKVRVSTTGTLPAGLSANTDYYVIKISDTEIRLATTIANAYIGTEITLTSDGSGTHTVELFSVQVVCYQQETIDTQTIGTSDGVTAWQRFDLPDLDVVSDTLTIDINGDTWTVQDSLASSSSTDKHCLLRYNTDGSSYLLFGDGTYGAIPANFDIDVDYATGGGLTSNIEKLNSITIYSGSDTDIVGVSNPVVFTGGANAESLESAKNLAPLLLKARDRFVTVDDGIALSTNYTGVSQANVISNAYGILSAQVVIVPNGGGLPSSSLKTDLQTYLIDRTVLESIDVRVTDPTYNTVTPVLAAKMLDGYTFSNVQPFIILALRLLFYEANVEIIEEYDQNGVASATTVINNIWSTSFGAGDYAQIITLLDALEENEFGKDFQESDVFGYVDNYVNGVDYITISSPSFPITQADDEITTENVISGNITEIP